MIEIKIDASQVTGAMERLAKAAVNATPVMTAVAGVMLDAVMENFARAGRPAWAGLKNPGKRRLGGQVLIDSARLKNSITPRADANSAIVGTNVKYAAIHQFGGMAGRGRKVKIPARPFLQLTEADEAKIAGKVTDYLRSVVG